MELYDKIQITATHIAGEIDFQPTVGIILGSGLGGLTETLDIVETMPYSAIPNFPVSTVKGHSGKLIFGRAGNKNVVVLAGRFHYYEGYSMQEVTFPVRVMKALGVDTLILSNAAGGMNKSFSVGDIMIVEDHINLFPEHPLRGKNDDRLGIRFPDMSEPYDKKLISLGQHIAAEQDTLVHTGVYAGVQGPAYETPAEYKWLHTIGADAVGMSTIPEVIVAKHGNMKAFAMSVITDLGVAGHVESISHDEVLAAAEATAPKMAAIVTEMLARM